ncbi:MlaD family protein [Mesonia sp. K7]|uniref:MlaD family protein n=1 Tax=Mesonia sp. K7 TaxID=2218606 RepID=UPI000DA724E7|nr:MlaD family protein [Mesonia sp. K7]PZD76473.1 MCE family protein [Mesonia sp. K7]
MKITREVKTALLVIIAIILLIFGYSYLKGNNLLNNHRTFYATYNEAQGLATSSPVTINGLQIGTVSDIEFLDEKGNILVTMNVQSDFKFSKNSVARIYGGNLIGGKSMAIIPVYDGPQAKSGDTLKSDIEDGLLEIVNDRLSPLQQKLESAIVNADSLLYALKEVLNAETRADLKSTFTSLSATAKSFSGATEKINGILGENQAKLDRTFTNLDDMSANFKTLSDSISKLEFNKIVNDFEAVASDFKEISEGLQNGKGSAGKLLNDDAVYENLENATRQLEQLLQDIKLNPKRYVHFSVFGKKPGDYEQPEDRSE